MYLRFSVALLSTFVTPGLAAGAAAQTGAAVARYDVTFDATWSAATHPAAYPGGAHFSAPVGATHIAGHHLWQPGGIASPGIEQMAELGATAPLLAEVNAGMAAGDVGSSILGIGPPAPGLAQMSFVVTDRHPNVSLVSMIAPSPDWFVGVDDVALFRNGAWVDELVIDLLAWDAGSDSGVSFTSLDLNTEPKESIALITGGPFSGSDPLGTFTFRRKAAAVEYGTCVNPVGSLTLVGVPVPGSTISIEVHDPGLTMPVPSLALFVISNGPHPNYPYGLPRANWGLAAPGATGEIMTLGFFQTIGLPMWNGIPVAHAETIPNDPSLAGLDFYLQGALVAPGTRIALTSALKLSVGL